MPDEAVVVDVTRDATTGGSDDPRVLAAVKEYLVLLESGPVSRDAFLAQRAEIADQLSEYLDGLEMVHGAAIEVRRATAQLTQSSGPPKVLGDFRILREIGRGGMGVVYEALHVPLARRVALKVLPLVSSFDPLRLQRFKIEAQAAARLQHPNIVQVYSVGSWGDVHYYAMQLIEGSSLSGAIEHLRRLHRRSNLAEAPGFEATRSQQEVSNDGTPRRDGTRNAAHQSTDRAGPKPDDSTVAPLPDATARLNASLLVGSYLEPKSYFRHVAELVRQAALALEHAHQCGVVHRDIKPANLLVDEHDHIWVADFGLARIATDIGLTRTGTPLGTLRYMSPEQAAGDAGLVDHRADVYSLGVTLYELLTLEPAIPGDESHTLLRRVIEDEPQSPRALDKNVPAELETIVLKAVAKSRDERYASARHFADDLQRWLDDEPILARPPGLWDRAAKWRRRHRVLVRAGAVFIALAMCGLLVASLLIAGAYQREAQHRRAAEASFEQARRAVDAFSELGETELVAKPELRDVRRRLLETALGYYREFEKEHSADPGAVAEMAATSARIGHIVDELKVLEGSAPLLLLSDTRVQSDLQLSDVQREKVNVLLEDLRRDRAMGEADPQQTALGAQKRLAVLLRSHEGKLLAVLSAQQAERLQQIARQQRAPFIFRSAEIITALQLTPKQRREVNAIIEEERIDGSGRQFLRLVDRPSRDLPNDRPANGGPPGPPPRGLAFDRPPGPPPDRNGPRDLGPPPRGPREFRGDPDSPPPGISESKKRATTRILAALTPSQRTTWDRLTGRACPYELRWGPDDLLPH